MGMTAATLALQRGIPTSASWNMQRYLTDVYPKLYSNWDRQSKWRLSKNVL